MTDVFEPLIEPQDYDSFRSLLHSHVPDTYDEWLNLQAEKALPLTLAGHRIRNIKVNPDEFVRYCASMGKEYTLDSLREFATTIAGGKNRY
jgi:hypothetical protein